MIIFESAGFDIILGIRSIGCDLILAADVVLLLSDFQQSNIQGGIDGFLYAHHDVADQVKVLTEIFGQVSFGRMLHCPCSTSYSSRVLNTKNAARSGHKVHTTKAINFHGLANFSFFVHGTFDNGSTARSIKFSCLVTQQDTDQMI